MNAPHKFISVLSRISVAVLVATFIFISGCFVDHAHDHDHDHDPDHIDHHDDHHY